LTTSPFAYLIKIKISVICSFAVESGYYTTYVYFILKNYRLLRWWLLISIYN